MTHFTRTLHFQAPASRVFACLTTEVPSWWTEQFEGASNGAGKSFTVRFGPDVFKTIRVADLRANEQVVWQVIDSLIDIPELQHNTEWNGTRIVWELSMQQNRTTLVLTHMGLTPQVACYAVCATGWQAFTDSLRAFIDTGEGTPFRMAS